MGEWPLVLFTVLSQLTAGAIGTIWLLEAIGKPLAPEDRKPILGSLILVLGGGLLISLFHLGHPFLAMRAITNVGSSWLSREIIMFSLVMALLFLCYFKWSKSIGGLTTLISILAVLSSAMVYSLPSHPAWNNLYPTLFFVMTAVLLGPLYVGIFLSKKDKAPLQIVPVVGTIALISGLSFALYISLLLSGNIESAQTGANLLSSSSFWARVMLGWLIPVFLLLAPYFKKTKITQSTFIAVFLLVLVGEVLGRELFYSATVALKVVGF